MNRTLCSLVVLFFVTTALAEEPKGETQAAEPSTAALREFRTQHLLVYTDLPEEAAQAAIERLERTLTHAAKYWGQDPRGQIQCYLINDLDSLQDADLPHRLTRVIIGGVGGVTLPHLARSGKSVRNEPTILASTTPGVAEHELVHAYCTQTFGFTGPDWYSEGMAEMVVHGSTRGSGVRCSPGQLKWLRESHAVNIDEVLAGSNSSGRIMGSLNAMLANPKNHDRQIPASDWLEDDKENVAAARREYLRSWALCYLLLHNPNYAARFRMLGRKQVTTQNCEFANAFPNAKREIAFEYAFFLQHICEGYRVDLCSWDWSKRFRPPDPGGSVSVRIAANHGYQPSGLSISQGEKYWIETTGTWSRLPTEKLTETDKAQADGPLCGVVMHDFQLSEPFLLATDEVFQAPASGNLYLRCQDDWNSLHDNQGHKVVRLRQAE